MAKKAFLVTYEFMTRVVVDIDDNCPDTDPETNDGLWDDIEYKAEEQIGHNDVWNYICPDNVTSIVEDTECPYGEE